MIYVRRIQIPGLPTREDRRLYVAVPRDYRRGETRYPVLYMFDGHNVFYNDHATYGRSWGMKEYLARTALPLIVVGVECNPEGNKRLEEYSPWTFRRPGLGEIPGRGEQTMTWMVETLKPEIDRRWRTLPDRDHTLIAGSSMGGLMALYAAAAWRDTFSRAAALSPTLEIGGRRLETLLRGADLAGSRVYLDMGTAEWPDLDHAKLGGLFTAARLLTEAGADVAARIVPGGEHREAAWEKRIPVFLDYLLGD